MKNMINIYGYARLSRDEDRENYSSIDNQINIIKEWAEFTAMELKNKGLSGKLVKIFIDDNASGYTLDRPEFNQLKNKITGNGPDKAHIVIAKDCSRIGRHNAKTLLFFELLQEHGVRIILASDGYDSEKDNDDVLGIKTWYNEMYVKDISRKIRDSIHSKQKNGGLIVKNIYGYEKCPRNKHQLVIDQEAASVVQYIFQSYLKGSGYRRIADALNNKGIKTPSQYHQIKTGGKFKVAESWNAVHVQRIIANDVYTGVLRCGKTKKKRIKGPSVKTQEEDQIVYSDHHPAIISRADFQLAQEIARRRSTRNIHSTRKGMNLFSGFLFCGDCGSYLVARKRANKPTTYCCSSYHSQGKKACSTHLVSEEELLNILKIKIGEILKADALDYQGLERKIKELKVDEGGVDDIKKDIKAKQLELKGYARQRARRQISEDLYQELIEEVNKSIEVLNLHLQKMLKYQREIEQFNEKIPIKTQIERLLTEQPLTRLDMELLIDKIIVKEAREGDHHQSSGLVLEVYWNFFIPHGIS